MTIEEFTEALAAEIARLADIYAALVAIKEKQ